LTVTLEPAAALKGEVRLNDKRLAEGFARLTSTAKDRFTVGLSDTKGRFDFDQLPAGDYDLEISDDRGQQLHTQKLKLEAGAVRYETITLPERKGTD
jgi:hypothetical protein